MTSSRTEQRMTSLEKANEVRLLRVGLREDLAAGRVHIGDVLAAPPDWLLAASTLSVLTALRGVGPRRARAVMRTAGIKDFSKSLGMVSPRQRQELTVLLSGDPRRIWA